MFGLLAGWFDVGVVFDIGVGLSGLPCGFFFLRLKRDLRPFLTWARASGAVDGK